MKMPKQPPTKQAEEAVISTPGKLFQVLQATRSGLVDGRYLHWNKVRFHEPPDGLSHQEWWFGLKFYRRAAYRPLPLLDRFGMPFQYGLPDPCPALLHEIDLGGGGMVGMPEQITNAETRDQYYVGSLMDEAITSSQLEGATTTRPVAKEMIRTGRAPRDRSEQMILNNYLAMRHIGELKDKPLSKETVFEIHRIVTDEALDDPSAAGRFRTEAEQVRVEDNDGRVIHEPPPAATLDARLKAMCSFANETDSDVFIHPVIRSIILHFWLSHDHPFVDGNGRTARALFYWSMLHRRYWLCEYISISQIIKKAPVKYGLAFLHTETDENDLTYFILYHLEVLRRSVVELRRYIAHKTKELRRLDEELRGLVVFNQRQRALIGHALRHPHQRYTIESHKASHNIVYQTARTDLLELEEKELLQKVKVGKTYYFVPAADLADRLAKIVPL